MGLSSGEQKVMLPEAKMRRKTFRTTPLTENICISTEKRNVNEQKVGLKALALARGN